MPIPAFTRLRWRNEEEWREGNVSIQGRGDEIRSVHIVFSLFSYLHTTFVRCHHDHSQQQHEGSHKKGDASTHREERKGGMKTQPWKREGSKKNVSSENRI